MSKINIFWFRRDLRLEDNAGLFHALSSPLPVLPVFIFDSDILDELEDRKDGRVNFIHAAVLKLDAELKKKGSGIDCRFGTPLTVFEQLVREHDIGFVFTNHDYEPYATSRDAAVMQLLQSRNIPLKTFKDQVIFEKNEIVKDNAEPYSVFTPYARKWISTLTEEATSSFHSENLTNRFLKFTPQSVPTLEDLGFVSSSIPEIPIISEVRLIQQYDQMRNFPAREGTSRLGIHLRFGTISIRKLVTRALSLNPVFLNELVWREFFMQMLWQQPSLVSQSCKQEYDRIIWRNHEREFQLWCEGKTGYPLVDAGMRELNATGFMHNRVRMVTASFLVKHLLIDWRWGENYFAKKLMDFEFSSNIGNWQWVAGCGCDAAPYFRIFNPQLQAKKFDPHLEYIRKWIPELDTLSYPLPIVNHEMARQRCLQVYKAALHAS